MEAFEDIIFQLQCLKEDKGFYMDYDTIKEYILQNMDELIAGISKEINKEF